MSSNDDNGALRQKTIATTIAPRATTNMGVSTNNDKSTGSLMLTKQSNDHRAGPGRSVAGTNRDHCDEPRRPPGSDSGEIVGPRGNHAHILTVYAARCNQLRARLRSIQPMTVEATPAATSIQEGFGPCERKGNTPSAMNVTPSTSRTMPNCIFMPALPSFTVAVTLYF